MNVEVVSFEPKVVFPLLDSVVEVRGQRTLFTVFLVVAMTSFSITLSSLCLMSLKQSGDS